MKKVLVLGGTRFFGKRLVQLCIDAGYDVTIATRGNAPLDFIGEFQHVCVDRTNPESLRSAFTNTTWDVVYDNICYNPNELRSLVDVLKGNVGLYVFTSSLAVYDKAGFLSEEDWNPADYALLD
ncbi:MAG: NAD-dependent epimerase/dehydratase family protein, partial [Bacilli bacterium]